jgi:hypothetical protein
MRAVWKFETHFPVSGGEFDLEMPDGARVLSFGLDPHNDLPVVWALVDPKRPVVVRHFYASWTGPAVPERFTTYVGTVAVPSVGLVFHLFETRRDEQT